MKKRIACLILAIIFIMLISTTAFAYDVDPFHAIHDSSETFTNFKHGIKQIFRIIRSAATCFSAVALAFLGIRLVLFSDTQAAERIKARIIQVISAVAAMWAVPYLIRFGSTLMNAG